MIEIIKTLPPALLWFISIALIVIIGVIAIFLIKKLSKGGTIKTDSFSIIIPENIKEKSATEQNPLFSYMMDILENIRESKYSRYLKFLKIKLEGLGLSPDLVNNDDSRFYYQCLGNIVYSGNGIRSIKTILEYELVTGEYLKHRRHDEFEKYINRVADACMHTSTKYLNSNYDNSTLYNFMVEDPGDNYGKIIIKSRRRLISCEDLFIKDKVNESRTSLLSDLSRLFEYALSLNGGKNE